MNQFTPTTTTKTPTTGTALDSNNLTDPQAAEGKTQGEDYEQQGFGISERPKTAFGDRFGTVAYNRRQQVTQETKWSLDDMVHRFSYVDTYPWKVTDAPHTILAKLRVPEDFVVNSLVQAPFSNMTLFHGGLDVHIQTTSVPANLGKVVAVFVPLSTDLFAEGNILNNFSSLMVNPHVSIFANANTSALLKIPFNSPQTYLNLINSSSLGALDVLGYVYLVVFNPLQSLGSDTTSIRIMSQFTDTEFKLPRYSGNTRTIRAKPQSGVKKGAQPTSVKPSLLETVAASVLPENIIGDAIGTLMMALDKPTDTMMDPPNKVVSTQKLNSYKGVDLIDSMAYDSARVATCDIETFATNTDEMEFDHLKSITTYLGSFSVSTNESMGSVVASFPMNPQPDRIVSSEDQQITLLGYLTKLATYWRGGITYTLEAVSSSLQTLTLLVNLNYGTFNIAAPGSLPITSSQYGKLFEINQGSNQFVFTAEYAAVTPYLRLPSTNVPDDSNSMGQLNISIATPLVAPTNTPSEVQFNVFMSAAADFEMSVFPIERNFYPVYTPGAGVKQFAKKLYVQEEEIDSDIEVIPIQTHRRVRARPQSGYSAQPLMTPANVGQTVPDDVLAHGPDQHIKRPLTMQSNIQSIRDLLKKYQYVRRLELKPPSKVETGAFRVLDIMELACQSTLGGLPGTLLDNALPGYFSDIVPLFRMYKGGFKFKIMINQIRSDYNFSVYYIPPLKQRETTSNDELANTLANTTNLYPGTTASYPADYQRRTAVSLINIQNKLPLVYTNGIDKTSEFEIPFTSRYNAVITRNVSEQYLRFDEVGDLGSIGIYFPHANDIPEDIETFKVDIFMSISDEGRFGTLFHVPRIALNTIKGAPVYPDTYQNGSLPYNTLKRL